MTTTKTRETVETRFGHAVEAAQALGVVTALNVMTCCRSCTRPEDLGLTPGQEDTVPYAWTFGGQGHRIEFDGGQPVHVSDVEDECTCTADEYDEDDDGNEVLTYEGEECDTCRYGPDEPERTPARSAWFYHGGPDVTAARVVSEAFAAKGFTVEWDGSTGQAVQVVL